MQDDRRCMGHFSICSTIHSPGTNGGHEPYANSCRGASTLAVTRARLDIGDMDDAVEFYFAKGLAQSTQRSYNSGCRRFALFCDTFFLQPSPVTEHKLCIFTAHLASQRLKHRTIKVYLASIRFNIIKQGLHNPFLGNTMERLEYVLRGIKREEAERQPAPTRRRLPITPDILIKLKAVWSTRAGEEADMKMLWAACCLGFFAFLRAGEFTVPSDTEFDEEVHLTWNDVSIDDPGSPSFLRVHIKQSKTDPFREGTYLYVGRTGTELCPVAAILEYMCLRGQGRGPLFRFKDGRPLTRPRLVEALRSALNEAGINQADYCSHSFRIGAATTAAQKGVEDSVIKTLGRWKSVAYQQYVRIPTDRLVGLSAVLATLI